MKKFFIFMKKRKVGENMGEKNRSKETEGKKKRNSLKGRKKKILESDERNERRINKEILEIEERNNLINKKQK